jgi:hypothetical protein
VGAAQAVAGEGDFGGALEAIECGKDVGFDFSPLGNTESQVRQRVLTGFGFRAGKGNNLRWFHPFER